MAEAFNVPTKVLIDQGQASLNALKAEANRAGRTALATVAFDVQAFLAQLQAAVDATVKAEAEQERAKVEYTREVMEDRAVAEAGYRWILRLQARVQMYEASLSAPSAEDLSLRFRRGQLRRARLRGVAYELQVLLPEAEAMRAQLEPFGVTADFLGEGAELIKQLRNERAETSQAVAHRSTLTREVRRCEKDLSRLLTQLNSADEAAALETVEARRWFNLDIIAAERGRVEGARQARLAARAPEAPAPDEDEALDDPEVAA